jgi:uncharacterized protein YabE (DUF348 family)
MRRKTGAFIKRVDLNSPEEATVQHIIRPEDKIKTEYQPLPKIVQARIKLRQELKTVFSVSSVIGILVIIMAFFTLNSYYDLGAFIQHKYTIIADDKTMYVASSKTTINGILNELDVKLNPGDIITPSPDTRPYDGMTIRVSQPFDVFLHVDKRTITVTGGPAKVSDILEQAKVQLGEMDQVSIPLSVEIINSRDLYVYRVWQETIAETEEINPSITRKEDATLAAGTNRVIAEGKPGIRENTILVTYKDGEIVDKEIIASEIIEKAESSVVAYGTMVVASRGTLATEVIANPDGGTINVATTPGGSQFEYTQSIAVQATAYTHTGNRTATGTWPKVGTIAVDPKVIPLGTKVYVEGYGFATAEDTGGAIKGNIIDIFLDTRDECLQWGRKNVTIYILP